VGLGILGSAVGAFGQLEAGEAQSQAAAMQAQIARNNANAAMEGASLTSAAGAEATTAEGLKTRAQLGTFKAATGAAGVDVNTGSAAAVGKGIQQMGMQNALTIRSKYAQQAWAKEVEATGDIAQADVSQFQSNVASTLAPIQAAGTLLSGASKFL
jgi:hypothetical protein